MQRGSLDRSQSRADGRAEQRTQLEPSGRNVHTVMTDWSMQCRANGGQGQHLEVHPSRCRPVQKKHNHLGGSVANCSMALRCIVPVEAPSKSA